MAFAIMRMEKIKSFSDINGKDSHNKRTRKTDNADEKRIDKNEHYGLFSGDDLGNQIKKHYQNLGLKIRKNGILATEFLLTASPEFYRKDPNNYGAYKPNLTKAFNKRAIKFLEKTFGEKNIASIDIHYDEATPHIHAIIMPIYQGKLRMAHWSDGPQKMRKLQDDFYKEVQDLGLERGIKGSKATHLEIKKYYGEIKNDALDTKVSLSTPPKLIGREEWRDEEEIKINNQLKPLIFNSKKTKISVKKNKELRRTLRKKEQEIEKMKKRISELELAEARKIDLNSILEKWGFEYQESTQKWKNGDMSINIKGQKFYDYKSGQGGGGAIDLVMLLEKCSFKQAASLLLQKDFSTDKVQEGVRQSSINKANNYIKKNWQTIKKTNPFVRPENNFDNESVFNYLTTVRKIDPVLIREQIENGSVFANNKYGYVNCVFSNPGKNIAEIRGMDSKYKGLGPGSDKKRFGFEIGNGDKIVLVESAIDALSYYELSKDKNIRVISLAGENKNYQYVNNIIKENGFTKVVLAFDNDKQGHVFAEKYEENLTGHVFIDRETPCGKDWNDDLVCIKTEKQQREKEKCFEQKYFSKNLENKKNGCIINPSDQDGRSGLDL
jgi:hypothetical protein